MRNKPQKQKSEIEKLVKWFFLNIEPNEANIIIFKDLLYTKITCISHEVHFAGKKVDSYIRHNYRADFREYLKKYSDNLIERLKNERERKIKKLV